MHNVRVGGLAVYMMWHRVDTVSKFERAMATKSPVPKKIAIAASGTDVSADKNVAFLTRLVWAAMSDDVQHYLRAFGISAHQLVLDMIHVHHKLASQNPTLKWPIFSNGELNDLIPEHFEELSKEPTRQMSVLDRRMVTRIVEQAPPSLLRVRHNESTTLLFYIAILVRKISDDHSFSREYTLNVNAGALRVRRALTKCLEGTLYTWADEEICPVEEHAIPDWAKVIDDDRVRRERASYTLQHFVNRFSTLR